MLIDRIQHSAAAEMLADVLKRAPAGTQGIYLNAFRAVGQRPPGRHAAPAKEPARPKRDALARQIEVMKAQLRKNGAKV